MADLQQPSTVWDEVAPLYGEGVSPFRLLSEELVHRAALRQNERVVDLGTGNGWGLIRAARLVAPAIVVGLDFSAEMLAAARHRADLAGCHNARLIRAEVQRTGLADRAFDVALASSVLQFVGYAPEALLEWRRLLRPGGRLVLSVPAPVDTPVARLLGDLLSDQAPHLAPDLAARVRRARPEPPDLGDLCEASGYQTSEVVAVETIVKLGDADEWWDIQWTHGARGLLRALDARTLHAIKTEATERLELLRDNSGTIPLTLTMIVCTAWA